jgi:hypothetical protein
LIVPFEISRAEVERIAGKYLLAAQEAGKVYQHIVTAKAGTPFVTEVSMDETDLRPNAAGVAHDSCGHRG